MDFKNILLIFDLLIWPQSFHFRAYDWELTVLKLRHDFISIKCIPLVWMIGIESPLWIVESLASIAQCFCFFEIKEMCNPHLVSLCSLVLVFLPSLFCKTESLKALPFHHHADLIIKKRKPSYLCKVSEILVITSHYRSLIWDNFDLFFLNSWPDILDSVVFIVVKFSNSWTNHNVKER